MHHNYDSMFESHVRQAGQRQANADLMAEILWRYFQPKSVVDLGCGMGFFLKSCAERGAEIQGADGDWVRGLDTEIPSEAYDIGDLNNPFRKDRRYDLAASIEVAEHLVPERSESFVEDLCKLSDVVLFSAGIPDQGGAGHINLRYQGEWARMFEAQGYGCFDPIRRRMAAFKGAHPWLMQNVLLYVKDGVEIGPLLEEHRIAPRAASYVGEWFYKKRVKVLRKKIQAGRERGGAD